MFLLYFFFVLSVLWTVGLLVYFPDFMAWRKVSKLLNNLKFYGVDDDYEVAIFNLYSKEGDILIATIRLYENNELSLTDEINYGIYVKPTPYIFFTKQITKKLKDILPTEVKGNFEKNQKMAKKSFKDYL